MFTKLNSLTRLAAPLLLNTRILQLGFSAQKEVRLRERLRLQFRFEAFAFTNTPRFGQSGATLGTSTFGKITGADTPRNLQFGLKLVW